MNISYMNSDLFLLFMSVGLTGRHRPQRWFTRSLEVTSGREVLPFFFSADRNAENKMPLQLCTVPTFVVLAICW